MAKISANNQVNNLKSKPINIKFDSDYNKVKEKVEEKIQDYVETKKDEYEAEFTSAMYLQGKVLKYAHAQGPLLAASAVGAGYAGYKLAKMAKLEAKEAIKAKSLHSAAESVALAGASVVSSATALNGAVHIATDLGLKESISHSLLHGLHSVMSVAGSIYGGVEAGLGAYDIAKGVKNKDKKQIIKGSLNIASGALVVALSTTSLGLPGAIGLAGVEALKILHDRNLTPKQALKIGFNKLKSGAKKLKDKISAKFKLKSKEDLIKESNNIEFHIADNKKLK